MAALFSDAVLDSFLNAIDAATVMFVLDTSATNNTNYSNMTGTNFLASIAVGATSFTNADDTSGRKSTRGAVTGISVTKSGTAAYIGLGIVASSTFIGVIPLSATVALTSGGTVDVGASKVNIQDPT